MENITSKPKRKKSKQKKLEENIALLEGTSGNTSPPGDDLILSPLNPAKYNEHELISKEETEPLCSRREVSPCPFESTSDPDVERSGPKEEQLGELASSVSNIAIAPELDLISTNFDLYLRKEGDVPDPSLPPCLEVDTEKGGKPLLGCNNIEEEFDEVTQIAASSANETPSFTESQLLSLYHNEEIGLCNVTVESFLDNELRSGFAQRHPLYDLLNKYHKSRDKLNSNAVEIETLIKETKDIQQRLWILEVVKITETGECQDGNPVEASHQYQVGTFDEGVLSKLTKTLSIIRERANEQHALHSYCCLTTKLQIENFVRKLIASHSNLPHNAQVSLINEGIIPRTADICGAVSVLFHFLRHPYKDQGFVSDCRNWLQNIVATLLRVSTWREHMFLLNHVLRCPGSVSKWATAYIQAPAPPFDCNNPNLYLDHMICMIATIVGPIKNREMFLVQMEKSVDESEDIWVMIDSEGEDEDANSSYLNLSENDVIALFNQIPLDCLFSLIFDLQRRDGKYVLIRASGGQMLKTIAVTRLLIKILGQGFFAYDSPKYQQFAKRLASTIVHTTQFLTDVWETFRHDANDVADAALVERLQIEYDSVVRSACMILTSSPQKSVLQFLITLPFNQVSLPTLWRLLQLIMQPANMANCNQENASEWWEGVEELMCSLNDAESCYILTAICNMALARSPADWPFIKIVTAVLLQIGIINNSTRDVCHKTARTQLSNLTHVHPTLMSLVLHKLKHFVSQAGNLSLYLFRELPLELWKPTKEDIELLEHWLLACPQGSIEGSLAIFILHKMNWGVTPGNCSQLFLPREVHCQVALLVVRLAILHCPESPSSSHSTVIADTIKQLTSSSTKLITEQTLNVWIWSMLFKLRLHLLDQPEPSVWATLANPLQFFSILPSLESLPSELSPLIRALKENQVTAVFTALLMTSTGHSIPLICHSGFNMLEILLQCHRYLAVLVLIEHIFPLFIESPGSLLMSEKFQNIVISLMAADRTFIKFAMSLISSAFPGLILKQFGDLIEVHLKNYRRYNLTSPAPLAEMWLRLLAKAWLVEPLAASYLMDKILSVAFFRPDMKATALGILHELLESQTASNKQRFSLLNWVTGNNPYGTLMNKSSSDTPWFSLFAIEVEQKVLFVKTTLWDNLLIELSSCSGKPSIDSSLKKCCSALKLSCIPSSTLPIYRWSQQVLETPVDHPAIPIFWQKFFALFLTRVPTINRKDVGSVGLKFFEGITNNSLLTKLKKKLQDCKEFYETKCKNVSTIVPQDKRAWYSNMVNLYTCYILWLEDPTLHDPGVNLYMIPASYCTEKLSTIFRGEEVMWLEFVDHDALHHHQRQTMTSWQQSLYRTSETSSKPLFSPKVEDPFLRIEKRLTKFESPVPPPALKPQPILVTDLSPEVLYNKHHTMEYLKDSFKALTSYAQVYWLRSGELSSVDFSLLELAPQLYRTVETQVTLHAACDTHNPGAPQQSINSLTCAGPAVIHIKVNEVHVDSPVDMAIHNNRQEAQNLIKRCLQQPNQAVCIGSIQVQEVVKVLEEKCNELRRIGDVQLLNSLQDVGVALFYHMTNFYTEKTIAYPPMKQLITSCVETLGQCFICVDEQQGPVVLAQVLENPNLSSLLSTHFSPTTSSPQVYILLYRTLMNAISASNADLIFVLLTKFDVGVWLDSQKPRLSDRSQLIEVVSDALATSGQDPSQDFIMIHEVLRRQLCALMMADCSQHLPQVLQLALRHSESHSLSSDVWFDIVNALVWHTGIQFKPHCAMAQVVSSMATFATQQTVLSLNEIKVVISILSKFFTDERLQYGLYGLYPKYRTYVSAFTTFLGLISHALIASVVKKSKSDPGDNVCAEIWPTFLSLFNAWICPYFTHDLAQPTAAWIQQLTDDRSILLPWISADSGHAHKITAIFTESIRFFLDILPGNKDVFGYVWQFYVTNFAHTSVKEHILTVINNNLLSLNWQRFTPSVNDLDLMLRVSDSYVPSCHTFLGAVFIDIPWNNMIENPTNSALAQHSAKIHASLLHLLIKLSIEPNVRQSGKIAELLRSSKTFHWETVDFGSYESVVNWFVMSYDPRVVLSIEQDEGHIDQAVMELLRYAAGFAHSLPGYHSSTPRKRQAFVRAYVKLVISCLSKYKAVAASHQSKVETAIEDILVLINTVLPQTGGNFAEAGLLISEILTLVNLTGGPASKICTETLVSWISKRGDCIVAAALLRTIGTTVEASGLIGEITESVLESVFNDPSGGDWDKTLNHLQEPIPRNPPIENHLIEHGHLLTLYAFLNKRLSTLFDLSEEMDIFSSLIKLISSLPPSFEKYEKMIPIYHLCLIMASRLSDTNPIVCDKNLRTLVHNADAWAEYKPSWGFLGAIGLKRQHAMSHRMKVICKILCALILIQLPESKSELPNDNNIPFIRTTAQSPGGFTSNNTELGPSSEAHKAFSQLEALINDKSYADIRQSLEIALGFIRRTENSMHNAHQLFLRIVKMLYPDVRYIQAITVGT